MTRVKIIAAPNGLYDVIWNGGPVYSVLFRNLPQAMEAARKFVLYADLTPIGV